MANRKKPPVGRRKDSKNLTRLDGGSIKNEHGVVFTEEEKRRLESAANSANRKRRRMLEAAAKLPRKMYGVDTGDTVGSLQLMGQESDFILARKSKSLQRFKSHEDYERYMKNLERVNSRDYVNDRIRLYKQNFTKSLLETYGDEAMDIVMKVRMMKPKEYMEMVQSDETLEISYVPSDTKYAGRLNEIRASLGMKQKDEWLDEEYE